MKANNVITSLLVFICFALFVALELKLPCKQGEQDCTANTQRLQAENDSLRGYCRVLDANYERLQSKADQLQEKLSAINQTIVQLKNQQHEKINAIDTLTGDELYSFFTGFNAKSPGAE